VSVLFKVKGRAQAREGNTRDEEGEGGKNGGSRGKCAAGEGYRGTEAEEDGG